MSRTLASAICLLGLFGSVAIASDRPTPSPSQDALYQALSLRDATPSCTELAALTTDPVTDFGFLIDHATQPPWVGIRAAECLVKGHATDDLPRILGWLGSTDQRGFALVAMNTIDEIPLDVGLQIARASLAGPHAEQARERLSKSEQPEIRGLITQP